jgi:hypothetical protein
MRSTDQSRHAIGGNAVSSNKLGVATTPSRVRRFARERNTAVPQLNGTDDLGARIIEVIAKPADQLLAAFFDAGGPFAGRTFDDLQQNPRNEFCAADLLAASLLDVRFEPRAVRALLETKSLVLSHDLADIPHDVPLWAATDGDLRPAYSLWETVTQLPGVGPTKTSKLLARKRPHLIPIVDSVIRRGLPLGSDSWRSLRLALQDEQIRSSIENIRPPRVDWTVSTLRLLDAATWMRYSKSRNARKAREAAAIR